MGSVPYSSESIVRKPYKVGLLLIRARTHPKKPVKLGRRTLGNISPLRVQVCRCSKMTLWASNHQRREPVGHVRGNVYIAELAAMSRMTMCRHAPFTDELLQQI